MKKRFTYFKHSKRLWLVFDNHADPYDPRCQVAEMDRRKDARAYVNARNAEHETKKSKRKSYDK